MVRVVLDSVNNMSTEHNNKHFAPNPVPTHQLAPNSKLSDEDLLKLGAVELLKKLRKAEADNIKLMIDHGAVRKEINCRMQVHLMEIRGLKDVNQRLQEDNLELRDLCCFLDDDRQKGRKLAREWQRFGRYTASVMRQEVSAYQNKLRELESKQQELIKDNLELKQLCLYLDEERSVNRSSLCGQCGALLHGPRDEGDGSSSSTNTDEPLAPPPPSRSSSRERLLEEGIQRQRSIINEQILQYIKSLELKIRQLENDQSPAKSSWLNGGEEKQILRSLNRQREIHLLPPDGDDNLFLEEMNEVQIPKPETIVHAMKVLEVHDKLDKPAQDVETIGNGEKALVREMCNVVWRKLEDGPMHP